MDRSKFGKRYKKQESYFESIDTPKKAYILGFLLADGSHLRRDPSKESGKRTKVNYKISLGLQLQDKKILEKISSEWFIGDAPVIHESIKNNRCTLSINCKKMSNDLIRWGFVVGRGFFLKFPDIPKEHNIHLIRGYFDGNGSVGIYEYPHQTVYNFNIVGSKAFLLSVKEKLELRLKCKLRFREKKEDSVWVLYSRSKKTIRKIKRVLYESVDESYYLQRKYEKMMKI